jgi:ankyrin repeat domain-containing protein 50
VNRLQLSHAFNVLIVSRPRPDFGTQLSDALHLEIETSIIQDDIGTYIKWRLDNDPNLSRIKVSVKEEIATKLLVQSAGMFVLSITAADDLCRFRWVQCQLDYLGQLKCDADRRRAMGNLPPELPQTYTQLLNRIPPWDIHVASRALKWLICSGKPLRLNDLNTAAAIVPTDPVFDPDRKLDREEMLLEILGSLVKVNQSSQCVEMAHYSVFNYLVTPTFDSNQSCNPYYLDLTTSHGEILMSCFNYLSWAWSDPTQISCDDDSLLQYIITNWSLHAKYVHTEYTPAPRFDIPVSPKPIYGVV